MNAQQLKNSILQMAVQGKLVPQDPNDEPASVLLERIREEKEKLIKEGKIKKEKNPSNIFRGEDNLPYEKVGKNDPVCIADEVPFELPDGWVWARCRSLGTMVRGKGIKRSETVSNGVPCVRYGEIYTSYDTSFTQAKSFISPEMDNNCIQFNKNDVIFTLTGENKQDIARAVAYLGDKPVAAGGDLGYWTHHGMNPLYLSYYLNSPYCIELKKRTATGDIIVHISTDKVGSFLIPIPPLCEQERIIEKINETLSLINEYAKKEKLLNDIHIQFPDKLKNSILQQAVMGQLIPQDPNDEPVSVLLEKICAEKAALIKAGKIKKDKHESIIYRRGDSHYEKLDGVERCIDDEIPFEIPDTWEWCYLGALAFITKLAGFEYTKYIANNLRTKGVPLFKGKNVQNGKLVLSFESYIDESLSDELYRSQISKKCLLTPYVGTIGNIAIFDGSFKAHLGSNVGKIEICNPKDCPQVLEEYVLFYLRSSFGYEELTKYKKATAQESISIEAIRNVLIPIPPLEEQKRIVDVLENTLNNCNLLAG